MLNLILKCSDCFKTETYTCMSLCSLLGKKNQLCMLTKLTASMHHGVIEDEAPTTSVVQELLSHCTVLRKNVHG